MTITRNSKRYRRFGADLVFRIFARAVASLAQAGFLLILARELGPANFGTVAIVLSTGYVVSAVTSFGTSTRVLRIAADTDPTETATKLLYIRVIGSVITAIICGVLSAAMTPAVAILGVAMIASDQIIDYVQAYLAGTNRQIGSSLIVIGQRLFPFAFIAISTALGIFSQPIILASLLIPLVIAVGIPLRERARKMPNLLQELLGEVRTSTGYWMSSLAPNIGQLQLPALGLILDAANVGLFAIAARLTNPLSIMVGALQTVLMPELARRHGTPGFRILFRVSLLASAGYGLALCLSSSVVADIAIRLLGAEYIPARTLIIGMIIASGVSAVSQAFQSKLLTEGRARDVALIISLGSLVGLALLIAIAAMAGSLWLWSAPVAGQAVIAVGLAWRSSKQVPVIGRHSRR